MTGGRNLVHAPKLVEVGLRAELAAILRPQMAGMGAQAMRSRRVTRRPVQVPLVGVGLLLCMPSTPCRSDVVINEKSCE